LGDLEKLVAEISLAVIGPPGIGFQGFQGSAAITRNTACFHKSVANEITVTVPFCEQKCLEMVD